MTNRFTIPPDGQTGKLLAIFVGEPTPCLTVPLVDGKYIRFKLTDGQLDIETNAELTETAMAFKEKMVEIFETGI